MKIINKIMMCSILLIVFVSVVYGTGVHSEMWAQSSSQVSEDNTYFNIISEDAYTKISENLTLTEDAIYDNLWIDFGVVVDLNGHTLTVNGNLNSEGTIIMKQASDRLYIGEDYICHLYTDDINLLNGIMYIGGNIKVGELKASEDFQLILTGTNPINIAGTIKTSSLAVEHPNEKQISLIDYNAKSLGYTNLNAEVLQSAAKLSTTKNEANPISIHIGVLNGDVTVDGNIVIDKISATETMDLNGYTFTVNGTLEQHHCKLLINGGKLDIKGFYHNYILDNSSNGEFILGSEGNIVMNKDTDIVSIAKDYISYRNGYDMSEMNLESGIMYIGRNIKSSDFRGSGSFKVVLTGTDDIIFNAQANIPFVNILNAEQRIVHFSEQDNNNLFLNYTNVLKIGELQSAAHFNTQNSTKNIPELKISKMLEDVDVQGNIYVNCSYYDSEETMNLNGHTFTVNGTLRQNFCDILVNGGKLEVKGSYYNYDEYDTNEGVEIRPSEGNVIMENPSDIVSIDQDYVNYSYENKSNLKAGTMYIGGDIKSSDFSGANEFKVILTGTDDINFEGNADLPYLTIQNANQRVIYLNETDSGNKEYDRSAFVVGELLSEAYFDTSNSVNQVPYLMIMKLLHNVEVQGDVEINSNYFIADELMDLNGHIFSVNGTLYLRNQKILVNGGKLDIKGSYHNYSTYTDENGKECRGNSNGYIIMKDPSDIVSIKKDFLNYNQDNNQYLQNGIMYIDGNIEGNGLVGANNFKVVFTGNQDINITGQAYIPYLSINNSNERVIYLDDTLIHSESGYTISSLAIVELQSEAQVDTRGSLTDHTPMFKVSKMLYDVNIQGDVKFSGFNLYDSNSKMDLNGHTLTIDGTFYQSFESKVLINKGKLDIKKSYHNYELQYEGDSLIRVNTRAGIVMDHPEDQVIVGGDFINYGRETKNDLNNGKLYVGGDIQGNSLEAKDDFKLILTGKNKIGMSGKVSIPSLNIENPEDKVVTVTPKLNKTTTMLQIDLLSSKANFNTMINNTNSELPILSISKLNDDCYIEGDLRLQGSDQMDLAGHKLHISGDLFHQGGKILFNKGELIARRLVVGYENLSENSFDTADWNASLNMINDEDRLEIDEYYAPNDTFISYNMSKGLSIIHGDVYDSAGSFKPTDIHKTILTGEKGNSIEFENGGKFNILELKKDKDAFIFNPDRCWNELIGETIEVQKITLDQSVAELVLGKSINLKAVISPSDATHQSITWKSSTPAVATVDQSGKVTAKHVGATYITVKTVNGLEAKCLIKVISNDPKMNVTNATLSIGNGFQAKVTNATSAIVWRSSTPSVASVDQNGNVKALRAGATYIIAKTSEGKEVKCLVKVVEIQPISVSMNLSNATLSIGKTFNAKATVYPTNATNKNVAWSRGNTNVVKVDANGKVTTVGAGTTYVYAKTSNGITGKILVKVLPNPTSVTITPKSATVRIGATFKARGIVTPSNAATAFTFKSSSPSIAIVDANGNVKAIKAGYTYISVTTTNGKTAKFLLRVVK